MKKNQKGEKHKLRTFNLQKFPTIHLATSTYSTKIYNTTFFSNSHHHMTTILSADYNLLPPFTNFYIVKRYQKS